MGPNTNKIVERFKISQNSLVLQQSDLSLQSISDMVNLGSIDISPKYQRRERWNSEKESELIESFLLNIPVPPIYLSEDEYGTYSVIDGKQRITAINKFLKGNLKLQKLAKFSELEGYTFAELPIELSNALRIRPYLRVVTILRQSDSDLKHEVFLRLNKAGVPLNNQEIRNVAYRGDFNDLLIDLSGETYLANQLNSKKGTTIYEEMVDVQYVLRFFTVRESWENFPGNMDKAMDIFMIKNYKNGYNLIAEQRVIFNKALEFCQLIWGEEAFRKPQSSKRILQGIFDVQMVSSSLLSDKQRQNALNKKDKVKKLLIEHLENDENFAESITQFTSNHKNVKYRIETFTNLLKNI